MRLDFRGDIALVPVIVLQRVQGMGQIIVETIDLARPERILKNVEMVEERAGGM